MEAETVILHCRELQIIFLSVLLNHPLLQITVKPIQIGQYYLEIVISIALTSVPNHSNYCKIVQYGTKKSGSIHPALVTILSTG